MSVIPREITIGRDKDCDIFLDARCKYASGHHASVYLDGQQLMFRDESSNGTLINNVSVHRRAVPIRHGDTIMIAGLYPINWYQIDTFLYPTPSRPVIRQAPMQQNTPPHVQPDTESWSWGAFVLYPIWGFFNGCWWAFLAGMVAGWTCIPSILFGIFGRRQAWANGHWTNTEDFNRTQDKWDKVGLGLFVFSLIVIFLLVIAIVA